MSDEARPVPGALAFLAFFAFIALACWWSIAYSRGPLGLSTLWVASGLLCGFLLTSPRRAWPAYLASAFAASVLVNVLRNGLGPLAFILSFANILDAVIVAWLVSRHVPDVTQLSRIRRSVLVAALATVVACSLSALIAALARGHWTDAPGAFDRLFATWLASHALGMAIFSTLTIVARVEGRRLFGPPGRRIELAATLALVALDCWLVFQQSRFGIAFLVFPPLLLCVFRHHFSGFVSATALVAIIATMLTSAGHGPFVLNEPDDVVRTWMLQAFIACACLIAFPMAAALTERKLLSHRLAVSEYQYRMLADHSQDLVVRLGADGVRKYISPSATELLGWTREELLSPRWDLVHPDDAESLRSELGKLFAHGGSTTVRFRIRRKDGHYLWLEANASRVPPASPGDPPEVIYSGRDVTRRVEAEVALDRMARFDHLTGLANRLYFNERLELAVARQQRHRRGLALLYLDIDHFKQINDSYGHAAGDSVLREFATRLEGSLRVTDFAARLGGDEFVVLLEDIVEDAPRFAAEKLIAALKDEFVVGVAHLRVTTSIGIGQVADGTVDSAGLLRLADGALYEAKAAGRNTWKRVSA